MTETHMFIASDLFGTCAALIPEALEKELLQQEGPAAGRLLVLWRSPHDQHCPSQHVSLMGSNADSQAPPEALGKG